MGGKCGRPHLCLVVILIQFFPLFFLFLFFFDMRYIKEMVRCWMSEGERGVARGRGERGGAAMVRVILLLVVVAHEPNGMQPFPKSSTSKIT